MHLSILYCEFLEGSAFHGDCDAVQNLAVKRGHDTDASRVTTEIGTSGILLLNDTSRTVTGLILSLE